MSCTVCHVKMVQALVDFNCQIATKRGSAPYLCEPRLWRCGSVQHCSVFSVLLGWDRVRITFMLTCYPQCWLCFINLRANSHIQSSRARCVSWSFEPTQGVRVVGRGEVEWSGKMLQRVRWGEVWRKLCSCSLACSEHCASGKHLWKAVQEVFRDLKPFMHKKNASLRFALAQP